MTGMIKICGITRLDEALKAIEAGADALGFVFYRGSRRCLDWSSAAAIIRGLPSGVRRVGVFVDPTVDEVQRGIEAGLDMLQFHGEETPEFCGQFGLDALKAFRVRDNTSLKALPAYRTHAWLLDSYVPGEAGGTGARFNWDLAVQARRLGRPVILAGGLTPDNVGDAVREVEPYGVDVSSGVESAPGRKDSQKVTRFIAAARESFDRLGL